MTAAACAEATGRSPSSSATASAPASSGESGGLPKAAQGLCPAENRDVTGVPSEVNARLVLVTITPVGLEAENQGRTSSTSAALAIARTAGCPRRQSRQQRGRQGEHTPCRPAPRRCSARSVSVGRLPSWSRLPTPPHTPPSRMPDPEPPTDAERHPPPGPPAFERSPCWTSPSWQPDTRLGSPRNTRQGVGRRLSVVRALSSPRIAWGAVPSGRQCAVGSDRHWCGDSER